MYNDRYIDFALCSTVFKIIGGPYILYCRLTLIVILSAEAGGTSNRSGFSDISSVSTSKRGAAARKGKSPRYDIATKFIPTYRKFKLFSNSNNGNK